eukprot:2767858-Rhodomonas_salina.2
MGLHSASPGGQMMSEPSQGPIPTPFPTPYPTSAPHTVSAPPSQCPATPTPTMRCPVSDPAVLPCNAPATGCPVLKERIRLGHSCSVGAYGSATGRAVLSSGLVLSGSQHQMMHPMHRGQGPPGQPAICYA